MKLLIQKGKTSQRIALFVQDSSSTVGAGLAGLAFNTSSLTCYYWREDEGNAGATAVTLATATRGTFTSSGFVEKDGTNMPGVYEFGIPNAALAAGASWVVVMFKGAANMAPLVLEIELVAFDPQDAVRMGMTSLPNANAEAAGGLYTRGTGAGQINQPANGMVDTNPVRLGGVAQSLTDLKDFADTGYDPSTHKVQGVVLADAVTTVNGLAANAITATSIATDAITAAKIAADAIGASELAADAVAEIQSGLSTYAGGDTSGTTTLLSRLTSTRAGYLDNLSAGAVALEASLQGLITTIGASAAGVATAVWAASTRTLSSAGVQAIWDALTSALTTSGSIGKWIVDKLDVVVSTRLATSGYTTPPTVGQIADQVWDEALAGHVGAGSTGEALGAAGSAGDPWTTMLPGSYSAGQAGKIVGDALDGPISGVPAALLDDANAVETGLTVRGALRLALSALAGKLSGANTSTSTFRNAVADSKNRIVATTDATGRTSVSTDAS